MFKCNMFKYVYECICMYVSELILERVHGIRAMQWRGFRAWVSDGPKVNCPARPFTNKSTKKIPLSVKNASNMSNHSF